MIEDISRMLFLSGVETEMGVLELKLHAVLPDMCDFPMECLEKRASLLYYIA